MGILSSDNGSTWIQIATVSSASAALTLLPTDKLRFVPDDDFNGTTPALTFAAIESPTTVASGAFVDATTRGGSTSFSSATLTISQSITAVADIVADSLSVNEDGSVTANLITGTNGASADNFEDVGRALTAVTQGAHGAVTFNADGTVTYTPAANWNGTDTFTYTVTSGTVTETATVTVTVASVNDAPVATAYSVSVAPIKEGSTSLSSSNTGTVHFNGTGDHLATSIYPWNNASEFTVSYWMNPDRLTGGQSLVHQDNSIEMSLSGTTFYFWTPNVGGNNISMSTVLSVGTWTHIGIVGNSVAGTVKFYIDGSLFYTLNHGSVSTYCSNGNILRAGGFSGDGTNGPFQGYLDEISVWTVAKSAAEVDALKTTAPSGTETGLVGYWGLNEATGTTAFNAKSGALSTSNFIFTGSPLPTWTTSNLPIEAMGSTVSGLFTSAFSDATDTVTSGSSANTLAGIAITSHTADPAKGRWQYKISGTSSWVNIPDVSSSASAFVLKSADMVGFLPAGDYNGAATSFTAALIDSSTTVTSADTLDASARGGTTPYSLDLVTANTSVSPTNDAAVLSGTATNPTVVETDGTNTTAGTGVATLLNSVSLEDLDFATASLGGGYISVTLNQYVTGDILDIPTGVTNAANAVQLSGTNVQLGDGSSWTTIATVDGTSNGQAVALKLNLNSTATEANIGYVLQAIRFRSTSDNPTVNNTKTTRAYTVLVNDGANNNLAGGAALDSNTLTGTITITPANDLPVADLNGATAGINNTVTWTETANASHTAITLMASATLSDNDNTKATSVTFTLSGFPDGDSEVFSIGGASFLLGTTYTGTLVSSNAFSVSYSPATRVVTIVPNGATTADLSVWQTLLRGVTYNNTSTRPSTNSSLTFDGVDDKVVIPDSSALDLSASFTLEAWINPTGAGGNSGGIIFNKENSFEIARFANGSIQFALSANGTGSDWVWVNTGLSVALNAWTHVAMVKNGSTVTIYLNGGTAAGGTQGTISGQPATLGANASDLYIGGRTAFAQGFQGKMHEARVWNVARSQSEVQSGMALAVSASASGLVGYWDLREVSGTVANDRSASENSGTLVG
ncbi:MAG: Ig-like domain-containing protein, partial [Planctomycetota bacterium]|nr:Ig-like domain-containing protein [Planctomycetota bacterium]